MAWAMYSRIALRTLTSAVRCAASKAMLAASSRASAPRAELAFDLGGERFGDGSQLRPLGSYEIDTHGIVEHRSLKSLARVHRHRSVTCAEGSA